MLFRDWDGFPHRKTVLHSQIRKALQTNGELLNEQLSAWKAWNFIRGLTKVSAVRALH